MALKYRGIHVKRRARALGTAPLAAAVLFGTAACGPSSTADSGSTVPGPASAPVSSAAPEPDAAQTALAVLATLPVKGRAPMTGYDRDQFGQAWGASTATVAIPVTTSSPAT